VRRARETPGSHPLPGRVRDPRATKCGAHRDPNAEGPPAATRPAGLQRSPGGPAGRPRRRCPRPPGPGEARLARSLPAAAL